MRILLTTLNAKYAHSGLALKYLYMAGASTGASLHIREFTINNEESYIFNELLTGEYDVICFSCYVWNIEKTLYLCENLKKAVPELKLALGGPEVSYDAIELLRQHKYLDFIMRGEGEATFRMLCRVLEEEVPFGYEGVVGLVYRQEGTIYVNPEGTPFDFQKISFPYNYFACETDKIIYYESARGCPYRCAYCMSSLEGSVRALPLERVKMDVGYFIHSKVRQVKFLDRTFNWDRERCYQLLKHLIRMDNGITNFHFELCGELVDEALLLLLKTARKGLFQFEIGIQSTNRQALQAVNRNTHTELLLSQIKQLTNLGNIHIHVDLIAGLPYEDYGSFKNSFNQAYGVRPDMLQLGFLKLLKGTEIRERAEEYGYVYRERAPYEVICNHWISAKGLLGLKRVEHVLDLYYNKGGFEETLAFLAHTGVKTPFDFYEELATFFYLKGYQNRSHKKEDLYRILYKYASWKSRNFEGVYTNLPELLKVDMERTLNADAIKKFERKGWNIE